MYRVFTVEITTSALCNLNCTYCFEGEKTEKRRLDDKFDVVVKRINELLESDWFNENYDKLSLSFWGGEPTLNQNIIIDLINKFKENEKIKFHLYTNGYDRRRLDEIMDATPSHKIAVQISYDGKNITDDFRILKTGKSSASKVLENIYYYAKKEINLTLKSTIPLKSTKDILSTWEDFEGIYNNLNKFNNVSITYSPTIDYVDIMDEESAEEVYREFESQFTKIARKEIEFYKRNGHYLCSWFGSGDGRVTCSAGKDMVAIDVDGQSYACHGALYVEDKKDLKSSDISEDNFVKKVIDYCENIKKKDFNARISDKCIDCVATMCTICPVASHESSKEKDFEDRWSDRWVTNMCGFYKPFGKIDRAVQKYIKGD